MATLLGFSEGVVVGNGPVGRCGPGVQIVPDPDPPGPCDCGFTDSFTRTVAETVHNSNSGSTDASVGVSDAGILYGNSIDAATAWLLSNGGVGLSVNGSSLAARLFCDSGSGVHLGQASGTLKTVALTDHAATKFMTFTMSALPSSTGNTSALTVGFGFGGPSGTKSPRVFVNSGSYGAFASSYVGFTTTTSDGTVIPDSWWRAGVRYTVTLFDNGTDTAITVSDGSTTYSHTSAGYSGDIIDEPTASVAGVTSGTVSVTGEMTVTIDNIIIPEMTLCTQNRYEVFQRVNGSAWGSPWTLTTHSNDAEKVTPGKGIIDLLSSSGSAQAVMEATAAAGAWWNNPSYDMVVPFRTDNVVNTGRIRFLFFEGTFAAYRGVDLSVADGTIDLFSSGGDASVAYTAWADSDLMFLRFQVEAGVAIRARVWRYDEPEPSLWNATAAHTNTTLVPTLRVEVDDASLASNSEVILRYIDFEYEGKPCYYVGGVPVFPT